jgi:hypothetical protein
MTHAKEILNTLMTEDEKKLEKKIKGEEKKR